MLTAWMLIVPIGIPTSVVGIRLTQSVRTALQQRADENGIPLSVWLANMAEDSLSTDPQEARTGRNSASSVQPSTSPQAPPQRLVEAVIASIAAEVRHEQDRPLGSTLTLAMKALLETPELADVTDLRTARAAGVDIWVNQGARQGLIAVLFPDDPTATRKARQARHQYQIARRRALAPAATQTAARYGIFGKGAAVLDRLMRDHFAGMTVEEAIQKGPAAWLEAGVSEALARQLFGEQTAREALLRAAQRSNAKRRHGQASATNTTGAR